MAVVLAEWFANTLAESTWLSIIVSITFGVLSSLSLLLYYSIQDISLTFQGILLVILSFGAISAVPLFLLLRFSVVSPIALFVVMAYAFANVNKIQGPGEPLTPLVIFSFIPLIVMVILAIVEVAVRSIT